jgi:hypothetical protein
VKRAIIRIIVSLLRPRGEERSELRVSNHGRMILTLPPSFEMALRASSG